MQANALPENEGILEDPWSSPVNGVPPHRRASELCAVRLSPDTFEGPAISHRERGEQAKAAHNRRLRIMQSVFSLASRCRVGGWQEVAARDGELKTDWTEPRPERRSMGIEWRPSGSRRRRCLQGRPGPGRPSGTPDDGAGCTGFGWHRRGDRHRQARVRGAGRQQPTRGRVAASLSHLVRNPGMVPNETICGVRRFHRVVFQRCVRCPPILHESFKKLE
jgi:hypothetical protein